MEMWNTLVDKVAPKLIMAEAPPPPNAFRNELIALAIRFTGAALLSYFSLRYMMKYIDPTTNDKEKAKVLARQILRDVGVTNAEALHLSDHEMSVATSLVSIDDHGVEWADLGGAEHIKEEMMQRLILPLQLSKHSNSSLLAPPKGVLLHGPPGCGKTLTAKAVARAANARFINLQLSLLTDKWYGESQKYADAVFSLARKIQPCIIFIDEIDHEATAMMKAQFMSLWDGFLNDPKIHVIVMGATNRPNDVDPAILRRMPAKLHIDLPTSSQSAAILRVILRDEHTAADIEYDALAVQCRGMTASDLREVCRLAALHRAKAIIDAGKVFTNIHERRSRPINQEDMQGAVKRMKSNNVSIIPNIMAAPLD